nr:MAG: hypothetical protein [Caudoviricetes sp.]
MYKNGERSMAWVAIIDDVTKHPDADFLDICTVGGWKCVTKLGQYKKGDMIVYCSIDSFIPHEIAPFLSKGKEPREYEGVKGERLRTVKLKGQISQGLLLPLEPTCSMIESMLFEGLDVSNPLNIQKYEPPIPAQLKGLIKGNFPSRIPKTDEPRIQNLSRELEEWKSKKYTWEVSEKCDGSSMTVYLLDEEFGVCSRNLDLKFDPNNTFWKVAISLNFEEKLRSYGKNIAIQGELVGNGVNGNIYKMTDHRFYLFNIYDIDKGEYYTSEDRIKFSTEHSIDHVPTFMNICLENVSIDILLQMAEEKSLVNHNIEREGLVFKCVEDPSISFKAISNKFLMKTGG